MADIFETSFEIPACAGLLSARLFRNTADFAEAQPGIVVSGSWLTVKEQMAKTYAVAMAGLGYTVLTFDFSGWGDSKGEAPLTEMPLRKTADIIAATQFLRTLSGVRDGQVGYLAICASAMYAAAAIARGAPIDALACVAGWFHDTASVAPYYGGPDGVRERVERAQAAITRRNATGEASIVRAYEEGSPSAGMSIHMDYYAKPERGAVPEWSNTMSEETWVHWLTFDGLRAAENLETPTLFYHGDECALPENVKRIHRHMKGAKKLIWKPGFQADYYDRPDLVGAAIEACDAHFQVHLRR